MGDGSVAVGDPLQFCRRHQAELSVTGPQMKELIIHLSSLPVEDTGVGKANLISLLLQKGLKN